MACLIEYTNNEIISLLKQIYDFTQTDNPTKNHFIQVETMKNKLVSLLDNNKTIRHKLKTFLGVKLLPMLTSANDFDGFTTYQMLCKLSCDIIGSNFNDPTAHQYDYIKGLFNETFQNQMFTVLNACQKVRVNIKKLTLNEIALMNFLGNGISKFNSIVHVHDTCLDPKSDDILAAIILHAVCIWIRNKGRNITLNFNAVAGSVKTRYGRATVLRDIINDSSEWITHNAVLPQMNNYSFPIAEGESVILGASLAQDKSVINNLNIKLDSGSLFFITGFMNTHDLPCIFPEDLCWASQGCNNFSFNIGEILGRKNCSVLDVLSGKAGPIYQDDRMITFTTHDWNNIYKLLEKELILGNITSYSTIEFLLTVSAKTLKGNEEDGTLNDAFMRSFNISPDKWANLFSPFKEIVDRPGTIL